MVEEIDVVTRELVVRRWKVPKAFGKEGGWEYELGEPQKTANSSESLLCESSSRNPSFVARDSTDFWEWRVRNIPYPIQVYQLSIDETKQEIVLRTSNKKYFKRFYIPSLKRENRKLDPGSLQLVDHTNDTLTIRYRKPLDIVKLEGDERRQKIENGGQDGKVDCATQ
mmetsp:Transcript_2352/g.4595  ORF Transcript_2352/g.4595 Transcript_2352/m.4595 type:complete len:168 (-) Transcript_2352:57-560(-)